VKEEVEEEEIHQAREERIDCEWTCYGGGRKEERSRASISTQQYDYERFVYIQ